MEMKTSDLSGLALTWAAAKAESLPVYFDGESLRLRAAAGGADPKCPDFVNDWNVAGAVMFRDKIATWTPMAQFAKDGGPWIAGVPAKDECGDDIEIEEEFYGPNPFVAAMRCHATRKLGEYIDVPEELLPKKAAGARAARRHRM